MNSKYPQLVEQLLENGNKAVILYGAPGTGKAAIALATACRQLGINPVEMGRFRYDPLGMSNDKGCWELLHFHPGYTYENFVGVAQPGSATAKTTNFRRGLLPNMCKKAVELRELRTRHQGDHKFILIINDFDHADVASVFGEMLLALRYRGTGVTTPYTKSLQIPDNFYIIATMDCEDPEDLCFDRQVTELFTMCHIEPDMDQLRAKLEKNRVPATQIDKYVSRCLALNECLAQVARYAVFGQDIYARVLNYLPKVSPDTKSNPITADALAALWTGYLEPRLLRFAPADPHILEQEFTKPI